MRVIVTTIAGIMLTLTTLAASSDEAGPGDHAVVLTYHHIDATTPDSTSTTPAQFDAQLEFISTQGFRVWPLSRITEALQQGDAVPENVVGLSFDDAYASVFSHAHPRLQARGWPYTVFVSTDAIDAGQAGVMTWPQLRQLTQEGVEIGNHSQSHAHLVARLPGETTGQWRQRVTADIRTAQHRLLTETGKPPELFAYPYGEYTSELAGIIDSLGLTGFGQHSGAIGRHSDFSALPRFPIGGNYASLERLATSLQTRPLYVVADPPGPMVLSTAQSADRPALQISIEPGDYDLRALACYASEQGKMSLTQLSKPGVFRIQPKSALGVGRSKYNCTAPHSSRPGIYYWWSYLLMKPHQDGRWYRG